MRIDYDVKKTDGLERLAKRISLTGLKGVFKVWGERLVFSIQENFERGGRPKRWKKSRRAKATGGKTLDDTGRLSGSVTYETAPDGVEAGSNVIYGPIHHFGFEGRQDVRSHKRRITQAFGRRIKPKEVAVRAVSRHMVMPARPWAVIRREDKEYMLDVLGRHVERAD